MRGWCLKSRRWFSQCQKRDMSAPGLFHALQEHRLFAPRAATCLQHFNHPSPPTTPLLNRTAGGSDRRREETDTGPRIKYYKPAAGRRGEGRQQAVVFSYGTILGSVLSLNIYAKLLPALRGPRGRWSLQQLYQGLDRDELPVGHQT